MPTVADVSTVQYSGDFRVDSLLHLSAGWNYLLPARTTLYYTFDLAVIAAETPQPVAAFNETQKAAARAILTHVAALTGIDFAEVASGAPADFHFAACDLAEAGLCRTQWSYAYGADNVLTAYSAEAYIYLDNVQYAASNGAPVPGSAGYEVLLHEIGHALGLDHPFDHPFPLPAAEDNTGNTVMSYTHVGGYKTTFQPYDLRALAWIYGGDGLGGALGLNSAAGPALDDYAGSPATAGSLPIGSFVRGTVEQAADRDWLAVALERGSRYTFELLGAAGGGGTLVDPLLRLLSSRGEVVASSDKSLGSPYGAIEVIAARSGIYFLEAGSATRDGVGSYQLIAELVTDQPLIGTALDDYLIDRTNGASRIFGLAGTDRLRGGAGDDYLDGGPGIDTAEYSGAAPTYRLSRSDGAWRVTDLSGREGSDTLLSMERLQFSDTALALDLDGKAGAVAQIIRALFGPTHLGNREYVGIGLSLIDAGMSYAELVRVAMTTSVFEALAGGRSNSAFVNHVYRNVVEVAPTPAELAAFVSLLESGAHTQDSLALLACQVDLNVGSTDLIGLAATGIEFLPYG